MSTTVAGRPYHELYDLLVAATGETPGHKLAADLENLYARHPQTFAAKVKDALDGFYAGRILSPWAFVRSDMRRIDEHRPVVEEKGSDRETAIRLAEKWMRSAGLYCETERQVLVALFGDSDTTADLAFLERLEADTRDAPGRHLYGGLLTAAIKRTRADGPQGIPAGPTTPLQPWATDETLRTRMVELWQHEQARLPAIEPEREPEPEPLAPWELEP